MNLAMIPLLFLWWQLILGLVKGESAMQSNTSFGDIFEHCNRNASDQLCHKLSNTSELACCTTILLHLCLRDRCAQPHLHQLVPNCRQPALDKLTDTQAEWFCGQYSILPTADYCNGLPDKYQVGLISSLMLAFFLLIVAFCISMACYKKQAKDTIVTKYSIDADTSHSSKGRRLPKAPTKQSSQSKCPMDPDIGKVEDRSANAPIKIQSAKHESLNGPMANLKSSTKPIAPK